MQLPVWFCLGSRQQLQAKVHGIVCRQDSLESTAALLVKACAAVLLCDWDVLWQVGTACCLFVFVSKGGQFWPAVSLLGCLRIAIVQQSLQVASLLASKLVGVACVMRSVLGMLQL